MSGQYDILLIGGRQRDYRALVAQLRDWARPRFVVVQLAGLSELSSALRDRRFDAALLDLDLGETRGVATYDAAAELLGEIPILALTESSDEHLALTVMQRGAQDCFPLREIDGPLLTRAIRYAIERVNANTALQGSLAAWRALMAASHDSVTVYDLNGRLTEISQRTVELHRYRDLDEMLGMSLFELIAASDLERAAADMKQTLEDGAIRNVTYSMLRKGGTRFFGEMNAAVIHNLEGQIAGFIATVRDIGRRRQAEKTLALCYALLDSATRGEAVDELLAGYVTQLESFTGCKSVGVRVFSEKGRVSAQAYTGFSCRSYTLRRNPTVRKASCWCGAMVDGTLRETVPPAAGASTLWASSAEELAGNVREGHARLLIQACEDGAYESSARVPLNWGGRVRGLIHVADRQPNMLTREIVETLEVSAKQLAVAFEHLAALHDMRESEKRYRTLVETSPDAITFCKPRGEVVTANRVAAIMHGYEQDCDLEGTSVFDLVAERDRARARAHCTVLLDTGEPVTTELELLRRDGSTFAGEWNTSLVRDEFGYPLGLIAISRDITGRKRSEETARRMDKLASLSILAGGVAHDFNNLLTAVITNLSMASDDVQACGAEALESLQEATWAAKRARSLTRQLLTFAKGGAPIKKAASVAELLESTVSFVLRGSNCRAEFEIASDLWAAEIDLGQVSQVLENLTINASQAMSSGGKIIVRAENLILDEDRPADTDFLAPGKYLDIVVEDSGVGIPPEQLAQIFDPYFTTKQDGSGIGLAVAHSVIQNHGGHIAVESVRGQGTKFTILLPATEKPSLRSTGHSMTRVRGNGRVLVMDDDPLILRSLKRMIARLGYSVEVVPDGSEAIERYKTTMDDGAPFDAVIMDLTVPGGMGGVETIRELIRLDPQVKAIVSSGYSTDPVMSDHESYGFKAMVSKPYDVDDLALVLHELITGEMHAEERDE